MDGNTTDLGQASVRAGGSPAGGAALPTPAARPPAGSDVTAGASAQVMSAAVVDAWSRLLTYLLVVTMVSIAIMMPVVGVVLTSAAVLLLRAADLAATQGPRGRRSLLAVGGALLSLLYAASAGAAVAVALASLVSVGISADPLVACAWGAGASVYVFWTGPGVRVPCRRLARVVAVTVPDTRLIGLAGIALAMLAFLSIVGVVAFRPSFAPMYALQNSLQSELGQLQSLVEAGTG